MALVLLIDDDRLVADVVSATLGQGGHTVGVLNDGQGALDVIEFKRPAVVLLDCAMPGLPGIEVLRQIRSSKVCFDVPVLMLTARSQSTDREIAMRAGATGYMIKPFEGDRLLMRVEELIGSNVSNFAAADARGVPLR